MELFQLAKSELLKSNTERGHPFQYFCLGTFGEHPEIPKGTLRDN